MRSTVLHDVVSGKELNLDGSLKHPYRHPNYGAARQRSTVPYGRVQPQLPAPLHNQQLATKQELDTLEGDYRRTQRDQ